MIDGVDRIDRVRKIDRVDRIDGFDKVDFNSLYGWSLGTARKQHSRFCSPNIGVPPNPRP